MLLEHFGQRDLFQRQLPLDPRLQQPLRPRIRSARPLDEVMADFQTTHAEVLTMLGDLTDADLLKPYSYFQPNSSGEHSGEPVIGWIINNTYGHYQEHIDYIERLASAAS